SSGTVMQSYWSPTTSGQSSSAAGTSLALTQFEAEGSYLGFDFDTTWVIWEGLSYPAFRSNLQSPPPGLTGTALEVTLNNTLHQFGGNRVDLEFTGIPADSTLFAYAGYVNTQSDSITFSATPPTYYSGYHWVIGKAGSSYASDTLTFTSISALPGSPTPANVMVYYRSMVGNGNFSLVTSSVAGDSIAVTNAAFGEYIFGSNAAPLSVTISHFSGTGGPKDAELRWQTMTEVNNAGWQIERETTSNHLSTSVVGSSNPQWTNVALVRGAGTSNAPKQYSYTDAHLPPGRYSYRLKQLDQSGSYTYSKLVQVDVGFAPRAFSLSQNYPNPFNPTTTIEFTLPADGRVTLKVYDILGREVATLLDETRKAGQYQQVVFDASRYASGVYFAVLQSAGKRLLKKMLLIK
ncbi:MAG TPA: T9SS type A sorting domain-containing protein, partial [Terriglobia bacterium]|nr:T9SS type A sorting domain-containing protein [Terriglobia bacterium]